MLAEAARLLPIEGRELGVAIHPSEEVAREPAPHGRAWTADADRRDDLGHLETGARIELGQPAADARVAALEREEGPVRREKIRPFGRTGHHRQGLAMVVL